MTGKRCKLIGLMLLVVALFHSSAQGSRSASPPEAIEFDKAVLRHVWPQGLSVTFEGKAGDVITLAVTSKTATGGFDPFVRLLDPEEKEEASDDDSGGQGNCLIKDHALEKNGQYHVFIGGENDKEGEVEVLLKKAGRRDPTGQDSPNLPESLVPGQALTRAVWTEDLLFFFEGKAGEVITISVTSKTPGLDPHVALLDSEKNKETSDDDSGGQGNSLVKDHTLMKSGRYIVSVGTAEGSQGQVEVLLKKKER